MQQRGQVDAARARLAELEAGSRPQEIAQAAARVEEAQIEVEKTDRNFKRLQNTTAISKTEVDDAESAVKAAKTQLEIAQQQHDLMKAGSRVEQIAAQKATVTQLEGALAMATLDLNNTVIKAPVAATILERNVEVGEFVTNGFVGERGAKGYVVSIADLGDLLVEMDIAQDQFASVFLGQRCKVWTDTYRERKYDGVVQLISPVANRQKATIQVRVKITEPDGFLKPEMNATVSFLADNKTSGPETTEKPRVRIPASSIRENAVFVVEEGKATIRRVRKGMASTAGEIEIEDGLRGGEDLIVDPPPTLKNGDRVTMK
jgi:HlyD family secretion protein